MIASNTLVPEVPDIAIFTVVVFWNIENLNTMK
jgi:hypothetical protein